MKEHVLRSFFLWEIHNKRGNPFSSNSFTCLLRARAHFYIVQILIHALTKIVYTIILLIS